MPHWNPYIDLNQGVIIDIFDIVVVAVHFGEQAKLRTQVVETSPAQSPSFFLYWDRTFL